MLLMRTFVSVAPPDEMRQEIGRMQHALAEAVQAAGVHSRILAWIPVDKMHLTLRFLGETRPEQRAQVESSLRDIAKRHLSFAVVLQGVGVFPNWRRPGVLWIGFADSPPLSTLQAETETAAQKAGFAAEGRAYAPHLTLAYVRKDTRSDEARRLGEAIRAASQNQRFVAWRQSFEVRTVELMESELHPTGARYRVLASEALR
jgi:2'-5' RNA ligase